MIRRGECGLYVYGELLYDDAFWEGALHKEAGPKTIPEATWLLARKETTPTSATVHAPIARSHSRCTGSRPRPRRPIHPWCSCYLRQEISALERAAGREAVIIFRGPAAAAAGLAPVSAERTRTPAAGNRKWKGAAEVRPAAGTTEAVAAPQQLPQ